MEIGELQTLVCEFTLKQKKSTEKQKQRPFVRYIPTAAKPVLPRNVRTVCRIAVWASSAETSHGKVQRYKTCMRNFLVSFYTTIQHVGTTEVTVLNIFGNSLAALSDNAYAHAFFPVPTPYTGSL